MSENIIYMCGNCCCWFSKTRSVYGVYLCT